MSDYTPKAFYDSPTDNVGLRVAFEKVICLFFFTIHYSAIERN